MYHLNLALEIQKWTEKDSHPVLLDLSLQLLGNQPWPREGELLLSHKMSKIQCKVQAFNERINSIPEHLNYGYLEIISPP